MQDERPPISVIIPVYNCERYLADAIKSVLAQSYRSIELIVVDDGSTDGSAAVARQFSERIRYCYQPNGGAGAARNAGIDVATGRFFAFLDADDLWVEDKLTRQMAAFGVDDSLDIIFGHVQQFMSPELPEDVKKRIRCRSEAMPGRVPGTMLVRRKAFFRVGYFGRAMGEGLDWASRATELSLPSKMLSEVVLKRRLHTTNSVILHGNPQAEYARYLKAALDRRRAEKGRHE